MNLLYSISIVAAVTGIILGACYLVIKLVLKRELVRTVPEQIKSMQQMFNGKSVKMTITIDKSGKTHMDQLEILRDIDYVG